MVVTVAATDQLPVFSEVGGDRDVVPSPSSLSSTLSPTHPVPSELCPRLHSSQQAITQGVLGWNLGGGEILMSFP